MVLYPVHDSGVGVLSVWPGPCCSLETHVSATERPQLVWVVEVSASPLQLLLLPGGHQRYKAVMRSSPVLWDQLP